MGWVYRGFQFFILILAVFISVKAAAITPAAQSLVDFETKANAISLRSPIGIKIPHVEIPLALLNTDFAQRLDPKIAQALIIEKDGQKFARWILNPEDTKWGEILINYFRTKKRIYLEKQYYFNAYQTASRSYIVEDPKTGVQFSAKSSTNVTGGHWKNKMQTISEAIDSRLISDFLTEQNRQQPFKYFNFLDEPAILSVRDLDQAVVIRDLKDLNSEDSQVRYLPGFSALHEEAGKKIAALNGSDNPYEFWSEHYIKPMGRALGELAARTGLQYDSPHSQNFLIELTAEMKPTGRIIFRDLADFTIDKNFFIALEGPDSPSLQKFTQKRNVFDSIKAKFGPLHGNRYPSWILFNKYFLWSDLFFQEFEKTFYETSGFDLSPLKTPKTTHVDYFFSEYEIGKKANFKDLFKNLTQKGFVSRYVQPIRCEILFSPANF